MNREEPIERLEEILAHPADKTFNSLRDKGLATKRNLADERRELATLLEKMPSTPPKKGTKEHSIYEQTQKQVQDLKENISKKHEELMEILRTEEKFIREIQKKEMQDIDI